MADTLFQVFKLLAGIAVPFAAFATGLRATDALWLLRRPRLLARSLVAILVVIPLATALFVEAMGLDAITRGALIVAVLSIGIAPPDLLRVTRSGARHEYNIDLSILLLVVSILYLPLAVAIYRALSHHDVYLAPRKVARVVFAQALIPLLLGVVMARLWPRTVRPLQRYTTAFVLFAMTVVPIAAIALKWRELLTISARTWVTCIAVAGMSLVIGHLLGGPRRETRPVLATAATMRFAALALLLVSAVHGGIYLIPPIVAYVITSTVMTMLYDVLRERMNKVEEAAATHTAAQFPDGFLWGTSTAAYQIEGAVHEDGRGASIWDRYAHTPGTILDGSNADIAVDHYHRYKEDVALMKRLGVKAYRFSIAWPRVFPDGTGAPNGRGLDFYQRLVDELRAANIEPFATLYHWDLPQALQDMGGWESRDTASAFADYAGFVARRLDGLERIFTLNEPSTFVDLGHGSGKMAPGLRLPPARVNQARHHVLLAHGLAVRAIRMARRELFVGPAEAMRIAVPVVESAEHIAAAEIATRELNAPYLTAILEGRYTPGYLSTAGIDAPHFTDADMKIISRPVDFVGINVYAAHHYVRAIDAAPGYAIVPGASLLRQLSPEAMYWAPRMLHKLWKVKDIYITENGAPFAHVPSSDGIDYDTDRIMFLRSYLLQLQRAIAAGAPVRGYFHFSLMDDFEWSAGYKARFGLYYVDHATQRRIPKLSAAFYREVATTNSVA
jgi:beta-glucosidase